VSRRRPAYVAALGGAWLMIIAAVLAVAAGAWVTFAVTAVLAAAATVWAQRIRVQRQALRPVSRRRLGDRP
jgi:dipeptide/tripeptide permease